MSNLGMFVVLVGQFLATLRRRWTRGPARPTWSFTFEWATGLLREVLIRLNRLPVAEMRRVYERVSVSSPAQRQVVTAAGELGGLPMTRVRPRTRQPERTVLYFHGGSYLYGSARTHADILARLALAADAEVLAVDYRLAPEHPFPAAFEDALAAYRALVTTVAPARIAVAGDSAGGGLTAAMLAAARDEGLPPPACAVLICPWVDLAARGGTLETNSAFDWALPEHFIRWAELVLGDADPRDPRASPLYAELRGLPPLLVVGGEAEMLLDQEQALVERARAAGVDVETHFAPDMVHDWMLLASLFAQGREAYQRMGTFLVQRIPRET